METMPDVTATKMDAVHAELQRRIVSGAWKIGERLPTEAALAGEFDCGIGTISKAMARLTRDNLVRRRTRAGTVVTGNRLPATVHGASGESAIRPGRSGPDLDAYAFVYPGNKHEILWRLAGGFQRAASDVGRRAMMLTSGLDFRRETEIINRLSEFDVKGAVLYPSYTTPQEQISYMQAVIGARLPVVLVGTLPGARCSTVIPDGLHSGFATTSYLIAKGLRRIGFVAHGAFGTIVRDQHLGYRQALNVAGIEEDKDNILLIQEMHLDFEDALREPTEIARGYLRRCHGQIEGVVCATDFLAVGMLRAAREEGVRVPDDLRIISTADNTTGTEGEIPLTVYRTPVEQWGRRAFEVLHATIRGEIENVMEELIRGKIIVRSSA
ncbi:MAG: GntR family transcriptional regulator [Opitutaceae bacterium]|jgi:DNA-binding LacI/PurR family transcriptional regulator|nr:GntR family transcriptional regulator [Opitutaceae bacterium]